MIVHMCEQRVEEWRELKRGVASASEVGRWIFKDPAKLNKTERQARLNLAYAKLGEIAAPDEILESYESLDMRRGVELEPLARASYEARTGAAVEEVGFVLHDSHRLGVSPDGFVDGRRGLLEMKCPAPATHIKYLHEGVLPPEYEPQVHMGLAITGCEWLDFWSYCPKLPSFLLRVERSERTREARRGLLALLDVFYEVSGAIGAAWDREFGKEAPE